MIAPTFASSACVLTCVGCSGPGVGSVCSCAWGHDLARRTTFKEASTVAARNSSPVTSPSRAGVGEDILDSALVTSPSRAGVGEELLDSVLICGEKYIYEKSLKE